MNLRRLRLLIVWVGAGPALAGAAPRIEFDQTVYEFGTTGRVQSVAGTFQVWNAGDAPLEFRSLRTTCGCTRATVAPPTLAPGQAGQLDFQINLGPSVGDIREHIYVFSNDPQQPRVDLTLQLYVTPQIKVVPEVIRLGDLRPRAVTNVVVAIARTDHQRLRVTKLEADPAMVRVRLESVRGSKGQAARLLVRVTAPATAGEFRDTIAVYTGESYPGGIPKPSVEIDLAGQVTEPPR